MSGTCTCTTLAKTLVIPTFDYISSLGLLHLVAHNEMFRWSADLKHFLVMFNAARITTPFRKELWEICENLPVQLEIQVLKRRTNLRRLRKCMEITQKGGYCSYSDEKTRNKLTDLGNTDIFVVYFNIPLASKKTLFTRDISWLHKTLSQLYVITTEVEEDKVQEEEVNGLKEQTMLDPNLLSLRMIIFDNSWMDLTNPQLKQHIQSQPESISFLPMKQLDLR
jgi:hypothetical protein